MDEETRERWLQRARDRLISDLPALSIPRDSDIAVTCGWPTRGALSKVKRTIGQCSAPELSDAGRYEVNISPYVADPVEVLAVLAHELAHVSAGVEAAHWGPFVKVIRAIGLEGKPTATKPGETLRTQLTELSQHLGPYPHSRLNGQSKSKQGTRLLKVDCPDCGYVVRITRRWIDVGLPTCPCGCVMTLGTQ